MITVIATRTNAQTESTLSQGLCPSCGAASLRVAGSVAIQYEVRIAGDDKQVAVVREHVFADGWELENGVVCPTCGWRGTVSQVELLNR